MMAANDDSPVVAGVPARPCPDFNEPDTGPFWRAAAKRELTFGECLSCAAVVFFPRRVCPNCLSDGVRLRTSNGTGTVYSRTTVHRHTHPFFRSRTPYVVALIDVDEGFRMMAWLVTDKDEGPFVGERVEVEWVWESEQVWPMFRRVVEFSPSSAQEILERQD